MRRNIFIFIALLVAFGLGTGAGVLGILWATGGNATPSRDAQEVAPTLDINAPTATPGDVARLGTQVITLNDKIDELSTQVAQLPEEISASIPTGVAPSSDQTSESVAEPDAEDTSSDSTPEATEAAEASSEANLPDPSRALYRIIEDGSEARFLIDEVLVGNPTTVVGKTSRIAGDIIVDFANPPASQVGTIAVNARTIRTDNEFRDQSIRGQILQSSQDDFEFITFEPATLQSLPAEPQDIGSTVDFQIVGNLTVRGTTREETFDVSLTIDSADAISGLATTTVLWEDYGITINEPPNVSDIGETVTVELAFVAELVEEA